MKSTNLMRVWDKGRKQMGTVYEIGFVGDGVVRYHAGEGGQENFCIENATEEAVVMRSVGLQDLNGTELYEDDIVQVFRKIRSRVMFKAGCFGIYDEVTGFTSFDKLYGYCQVLGNFYENPELLCVMS